MRNYTPARRASHSNKKVYSVKKGRIYHLSTTEKKILKEKEKENKLYQKRRACR